MFRKFILIVSLFFITNSYSQKNELGVFFGNSNYIGDVGPTTYINPFQNPNYVFGIMFRKNFNDRVAARISFKQSDIGSSDNWKSSVDYRNQRGKNFKNTISEISLGIDFNFFNFDISENSFQMTPYLHSGINFFRYSSLNYPIAIKKAVEYAKDTSFSIPITIGYKIMPFNSSFIIGLEVTANHSFTDNIDGSSPIFEIINPNSQVVFGSNLSQDWYVFSGFTLTYIFGNEPCYCPK
jgi:hypothetical protein